MSPKPILIVGSIALDTIETPKAKRINLLGGSTTYATIAAGFTAPVHVVGVVGDDFPEEGHALYQRFAEDLTDLQIKTGKTFRWGGRYYDNMDDRYTLFTDLGVFADFTPKLSEVNRQVPLIFLANIHPELQLSVIEQCSTNSLIVVDTMNLWINTTHNDLLKVLKKSNILLINEDEAKILSGLHDLDDAAACLQEMGPKTVVIKRGSQGAVLFNENERLNIGVYPVNSVIDTTGAGDTFGGGFMSVLANEGKLIDALVTGSALASISVEGFGVESLLETSLKEIKKRETLLYSTVSA